MRPQVEGTRGLMEGRTLGEIEGGRQTGPRLEEGWDSRPKGGWDPRSRRKGTAMERRRNVPSLPEIWRTSRCVWACHFTFGAPSCARAEVSDRCVDFRSKGQGGVFFPERISFVVARLAVERICEAWSPLQHARAGIKVGPPGPEWV